MRHVAFLRAINVGGHAVVKMTDLKAAFVSAGCTNVATVIQSGNIIFESTDTKTALAERIRAGLRDLIGGDTVVITRTSNELERMRTASPFSPLRAEADAKLYVSFLLHKPARKPPLPLVEPKEALDVVAMTDRDVFVVSRPKKNGFYGFPNGFVEKALGVPATTRNWSTVTRIAELLITGRAADRPRISSSRRTGSGRRT
jgi:uncharacterized protein (DUF1697 family)